MNVVAPHKSGVPLVGDENIFERLFANEASLLNLLVAIRSSDIDDDIKLDLRDLVLEYAEISDDGKKNRVKEQLVEILQKNSAIVEMALKNENKFEPENNRPPEDSVVIKEETKPVAVLVKPSISRMRPQPVFKTVTAKEVPEVKITETTEEVIAPVVESKPEVEVPPEQAIAEPESEASVAVPTTPLAPHVNKPTERIGEIKRLVNSKVGNPINLIDSENNVGREYMNALLDAMKKSSGGSPAGELDIAMARLEEAYLAVEKHLASHPDLVVGSVPDIEETKPVTNEIKTVQNTPVDNTDTKAQEVEVPTIKEEPVVKKVVVNQESDAVVEPLPEKEFTIPEDIKPAESKTVNSGLVHEPEEDIRQVAPAEPRPSALSSLAAKLFVDRSRTGVVAPSINKTKPKPEFKKVESKIPAVSVRDTQPTPPVTQAVKSGETPKEIPATKPNSSSTLSSVTADSSVTQKMSSFREEMKKRDAKDKLPVTDLDAPEVTAGLNQLLTEWKLFKNSGFLGTGPSGMEHPLYLKLRAMPMAAVIAGRFEGAVPEIKQSITDYMNGWRYEQGLVHDMGETFEHYLRRVILHIIERQSPNHKA